MRVEIKKRGFIVLGVIFILFMLNLTGVQSATNNVISKKEGVSYLSDMLPVSVKGNYLKDKNVEEVKINLSGVIFEKGLSLTSETELAYAAQAKYGTFKAVVGNDFAFAEYTGKLIFEVYADGKKIFESKPLGQKENETISVQITGAKEITLKIRASFPTKFAAWADAQLL